MNEYRSSCSSSSAAEMLTMRTGMRCKKQMKKAREREEERERERIE